MTESYVMALSHVFQIGLWSSSRKIAAWGCFQDGRPVARLAHEDFGIVNGSGPWGHYYIVTSGRGILFFFVPLSLSLSSFLVVCHSGLAWTIVDTTPSISHSGWRYYSASASVSFQLRRKNMDETYTKYGQRASSLSVCMFTVKHNWKQERSWLAEENTDS